MGDRGNVAIITSCDRVEQVWLYSHWGGSELPERVQRGLIAAKPRWHDPSYAAKIIIGHCVPLESWDEPNEQNGIGISGSMGDSEHNILVVDLIKQRVYVLFEEQLDERYRVPAILPENVPCWEFPAFCALVKLAEEVQGLTLPQT